MSKRCNWKKKAIVFASLISFVVLAFYPSLSLAQDATSDKIPPQKVELAQASDGAGAGTGAGAGVAGAGATTNLLPIVIYGVAAGAVVVGSIVATSMAGGSTTTAQH